MPKLYAPNTVHGPEVDFGVWWRAKDTSCHYRLTWEAYADPKTGYSERGDVVAISGIGTRRVLGRDIPLFVAEHFLSLPYNSVGVAGYDKDETGWVVAMYNNTIDWVESRLARWNGCVVTSYSGKERYNGEEKAARAYAEAWGFEARSGGWIYTSRGKAFTQGWRSFAADLKASRVIAPVVQEETGTDYRDRRYTETWVASVTKSTFGA